MGDDYHLTCLLKYNYEGCNLINQILDLFFRTYQFELYKF